MSFGPSRKPATSCKENHHGLRNRRPGIDRPVHLSDVCAPQTGALLKTTMTSQGIVQILVYFGVLLVLTRPCGIYMAGVYEGQRTFLQPILRPLERLLYWLGGVDEDVEQRWTQYAASLLAFSAVCF